MTAESGASAEPLEFPTTDAVARVGAAWRELRRGAAMQELRKLLYGHGPEALELGQSDTLDLLWSNDRLRMAELAEALRIDASTATRAVDRLVANGLVSRVTDPGDARAVRVELTDKGRRTHEANIARRRAAMECILRGFSPEEAGQLAALMERLVLGLDRFVMNTDKTG